METTRERPYLRLVTSSFQPGFTKAWAAPAPARAASAYYQRMESYAHRIRQTDDVMAIIDLLDQALMETHALESKTDVRLAPGKIDQAEQEIRSLKTELKQLRELVHVDHLTGMLNRGGLNDSYPREVARADRSGQALAIALMDIDDFKMLNDQHGHQAGDDALVHLAKIVRKSLRPSDVAVRFGGEEFLFLLPDTNAEQAAQALHRIQHDLDRQPLNHAEQALSLTFSAGIAIRNKDENRDAVISRADNALYAAKRAGKRHVCMASDIKQYHQP